MDTPEMKKAITTLTDKAISRCLRKHRKPSHQIPCAECVGEIHKEVLSGTETAE